MAIQRTKKVPESYLPSVSRQHLPQHLQVERIVFSPIQHRSEQPAAAYVSVSKLVCELPSPAGNKHTLFL